MFLILRICCSRSPLMDIRLFLLTLSVRGSLGVNTGICWSKSELFNIIHCSKLCYLSQKNQNSERTQVPYMLLLSIWFAKDMVEKADARGEPFTVKKAFIDVLEVTAVILILFLIIGIILH